MKPETIVLVGAVGCVVICVALFVLGHFAGIALLKSIGSWFGIGAFAIASLPLVGFTLWVVIEKVRHK